MINTDLKSLNSRVLRHHIQDATMVSYPRPYRIRELDLVFAFVVGAFLGALLTYGVMLV